MDERMTRPKESAWAGFEALYRASFDNVAGAVFLLLGDREEAFDVTQEAFTRTWLAWERVQGHGRPVAFTFRVAMNLSRSHLRRLASFRRLMPRALEPPAEAPHVQADERLALAGALQDLPPRQRFAVILCDLAGFTSKEAALILRSKASTVRVHLARARSTLRSVLAEDAAAASTPKPRSERGRTAGTIQRGDEHVQG